MRGITSDYTPFLLLLQGMALQLQGIALPPLLMLQGRSLTERQEAQRALVRAVLARVPA